NANSMFAETDLMGEWSGDAADRFRSLRERQRPAFVAMAGLCDDIAVNLEEVAKVELRLYTGLSNAAQDLIEKVTQLTGSYVAALTAGPWTILHASSSLLSAVEASNTAVL